MTLLMLRGRAGSPIEWVSHHRWHHLHCDTPLDPHSPYEGIWHAHFGWLLKDDPEKPFLDRTNVTDLTSQFFYRWGGDLSSSKPIHDGLACIPRQCLCSCFCWFVTAGQTVGVGGGMPCKSPIHSSAVVLHCRFLEKTWVLHGLARLLLCMVSCHSLAQALHGVLVVHSNTPICQSMSWLLVSAALHSFAPSGFDPVLARY
eukprot:GHUV01025929.1.p1 GENE.GHUV01025929.1~~GHUV01025929.1.p1  ORF type:complete len:201 (-),score=37.28 GHUV01025929.1:1167-1769(-)